MRIFLPLLVILTASAAMAGTPSPGHCPAKLLMRKDGTFVLDGKTYSDSKHLEPRLPTIPCPITLVIDKDAGYDTVARALAVLQASGTTKIGFAATGSGHP